MCNALQNFAILVYYCGLMVGFIADNELTALTKSYQMVFRVWILLSKQVGCCDTCEKRKKKHEKLDDCLTISKIEHGEPLRQS